MKDCELIVMLFVQFMQIKLLKTNNIAVQLTRDDGFISLILRLKIFPSPALVQSVTTYSNFF